MKPQQVKILLGPGMFGSVRVVEDTGRELDISGVVSAVDVHRGPDGQTTATLTLPWASGSFLAESTHVPTDTHTALVALGWTPPEDSVAPSGNQQ